MRSIIQRVSKATVTVAGDQIAEIGTGLVALIGFHRKDTFACCEPFLHKLIQLRIFPDDDGKMNHSIQDVAGELLLVPQFTLYSDTSKGHRPSFVEAARPAEGKPLFDHLVQLAKMLPVPTAFGRFQADMSVALVNEGPVTLELNIEPTVS